jgi:UDP-2,3-diacylglucosamine pyrophosphatase LpxH
MATLFLSDLHIGYRKSGVDDVMPFVELHDDVDTIVLLGDIFDFWATNLHNLDHVEQLDWLLSDLTDKFEDRVYWIVGNHDFDALPFMHLSNFEAHAEYRIDVFYEPEGYQSDWVGLHGDMFDDTDYTFLTAWHGSGAKFLNWINRFFKIDWRIWATSLSQKAQKIKIQKIEAVYKKADEWSSLNKKKFVIMGHTHNPCIIEMDSGLYICDCGDWREHRTAIKMYDDKFQLLGYSKEDNDIEIVQEVRR